MTAPSLNVIARSDARSDAAISHPHQTPLNAVHHGPYVIARRPEPARQSHSLTKRLNAVHHGPVRHCEEARADAAISQPHQTPQRSPPRPRTSLRGGQTDAAISQPHQTPQRSPPRPRGGQSRRGNLTASPNASTRSTSAPSSTAPLLESLSFAERKGTGARACLCPLPYAYALCLCLCPMPLGAGGPLRGTKKSPLTIVRRLTGHREAPTLRRQRVTSIPCLAATHRPPPAQCSPAHRRSKRPPGNTPCRNGTSSCPTTAPSRSRRTSRPR